MSFTSTSTVTSSTTSSTSSSSTTVDLDPCWVYFLADGGERTNRREVAHLLRQVRNIADNITFWRNVEDMEEALEVRLGGRIVLPELTSSLDLTEVSFASLRNSLLLGMHLFVHGDGEGLGVELLNRLGNWSVGSSSRVSWWSWPQLQMGEGFSFQSLAPAILEVQNAVFGVPESSLPVGVDGLYSDRFGQSVAWTIPFGQGRLSYVGFDYFARDQKGYYPGWTELLEAGLSCSENSNSNSSSNASTSPPPSVPELTCGSQAVGSTVGRPHRLGGPSGDAQHSFCFENDDWAEVQFSTCDSSFDTWLLAIHRHDFTSLDRFP